MLLCEAVANLTGGKSALRGEVQPVQRKIGGCLPDAGDDFSFILQLREFCGDEAENDLFAVRNGCKRSEAAGPVRIIFEIVGVHMLALQEVVRNAVITAGRGVGGVEIASADMGVHGEIRGKAVNDCIVDIEVGFADSRDSVLVRVIECVAPRIDQHAPGAVSRLRQPAA